MTQRVTCFLGLPGAGKTTQIETVAALTGWSVYHVGKFARAQGQTRAADGALIQGMDESFLEHALTGGGPVILDGFPRSLEQARALHARGLDVTVIVLDLPVAESLVRQQGRDGADPVRQQGKIARALAQDLPTVALCESLFRVVRLDATLPLSEVTEQVRGLFGFSIESLPWDRAALRALAAASAQTGIEAWAISGTAYRPFWNGIYGPVQSSTDVDVMIERGVDVDQFVAALPPIRNWAVLGWDERTPKHYPAQATFPAGRLAYSIPWKRGMVRMDEAGRVDLRLPLSDERDLRAGLLCAGTGQSLASLVLKARSEYPGLRIVGLDGAAVVTVCGHEAKIAAEYMATHGPIFSDWATIDRAVRTSEHGGRSTWTGPATEYERLLMLSVVDFYRTTVPTASAAPAPICPKPDRAMTLSQAVRELDDVRFRGWIQNQTRSRTPVGGRDHDLHSILDRCMGVGQKPTHQGWDLRMHTIACVLQVVTTDLSESERVALRMGALWHDVGKIVNSTTPGCHEAVGRKMFLREVPAWLSPVERDLVAALIACHDLFGRMARGISERTTPDLTVPGSYRGAMDPTAVRATLVKHGLSVDLCARIWTADVASVAALRWLLPLLPTLQSMIEG